MLEGSAVPRLKALVLIVVGLTSVFAIDAVVSAGNAKDEIIRQGRWLCRVRFLGCSRSGHCCYKASCNGGPWATACAWAGDYIPIEPLH